MGIRSVETGHVDWVGKELRQKFTRLSSGDDPATCYTLRCNTTSVMKVRNTINMGRKQRRKSKATENLKTGRFDNIDSAAIISSVC